MNTKTVFSTKAEKYAKYRWDYASNAIKGIIDVAQLSTNSCIADIGAGTGILTKHFIGKAQRIYAIEPNTEMRQILEYELGATPSVSVIDGSAEVTKLPQESVNLITVAQSIHWFEPEPARKEMRRILKTNGWLAILRNYGTDKLNKLVSGLMTEEYGANFSTTIEKPKEKPIRFYYGNDSFQKMIYPFQFQQDWEGFIGAITSASFMPNENHPFFNKLEDEAKKIFSEYSDNGNLNGMVNVQGETELFIGQPSNS